MSYEPEELPQEAYQAAKEQMGTVITDALDRRASKMAFNVLSVFDMPHSVRGYLQHARTLAEVALIFAIAQGYVELTEKGKANIEVPEDGQQSFSLPSEGGQVIPLHPNEGQYL